MSVTVHQFPCLDDNYGFLVRDDATGRTACIDTPDADAILRELDRKGWSLDFILNTHWHSDHAGGNMAVKAATGATIIAPAEVGEHGPVDLLVVDGDIVEMGETHWRVIDCGGHTLGHIAYYSPEARMLFAGDTLFPMGCGRVFEGTPEQMWTSLSRLASLPRNTLVYSAHEYTLSNARFALSVDSSMAVRERADRVTEARQRGEPTVPTTIGEEQETNPFLRAPSLGLTSDTGDPVEAFARVRAAKDVFRG